MTSSRRRWSVTAAVALVVVPIVAGCTGGSSVGDSVPVSATGPTPSGTASSEPVSSGPVATPTVVVTTTVSAAPSGSGGGGSNGGSTDGSDGPGLCTPTVAYLATGDAGAGLGHAGFLVHVTNGSKTACVTTGYPGVALLGADGGQTAQAARTLSGYLGGLTGASEPPQLTLQPGQEATALVEGDTAPDACTSTDAVLVTLPDNTDSTRLTLTTGFVACHDLQVHPLLPGDTGRSG